MVPSKTLLEAALNGATEVLQSDEMFELLDQFKCFSLLTVQNAGEVLTEIAKQKLIQKPFLMALCRSRSFKILSSKEEFSSKESLKALYEHIQPTPKKVIALFETSPGDDAERDVFNYLKRFIRGLDLSSLKKLLRFSTGADVIVVKKICVSHVKDMTTFTRRPFFPPYSYLITNVMINIMLTAKVRFDPL